MSVFCVSAWVQIQRDSDSDSVDFGPSTFCSSTFGPSTFTINGNSGGSRYPLRSKASGITAGRQTWE